MFRSGPGATRTRDLLLRRQALYPTELRTRMGAENSLPRNLSATSRRPFRSSSLGFILWQTFLPPRERGEALGDRGRIVLPSDSGMLNQALLT